MECGSAEITINFPSRCSGRRKGSWGLLLASMGCGKPDNKGLFTRSSFTAIYMQTRLLQSVFWTYQCTDFLLSILSTGNFAKRPWYQEPIHHHLTLRDDFLIPPYNLWTPHDWTSSVNLTQTLKHTVKSAAKRVIKKICMNNDSPGIFKLLPWVSVINNPLEILYNKYQNWNHRKICNLVVFFRFL